MAVNWMMNPLGVLDGIFSAINTAQTNKMNYKIAQETNKANRELVEMQNKAAKQESELAYKRSSAPNQVGLMTASGMSRAAAINALNGGGSYTPAPVNTSQDQSAQMQTTDFSGLSNILQLSRQKATEEHEERMQDKQIQAQKDMQKEQLEFEKQKWNDEAPYRSESLTALQFQNRINNELANYKDENGNKVNLLVEGAAAERIANMAENRLNTLKFDIINSALELPASVLKTLIIELNQSLKDSKGIIEQIRSGNMSAKEIEKFVEDDGDFPSQISQDGKKFRRVRNSDGTYEWYEVK